MSSSILTVIYTIWSLEALVAPRSYLPMLVDLVRVLP